MLGLTRDGDQHVREAMELPNAAPAHRDERFAIAPEQYRKAEKAAKERNLRLIGFFHSHPNHRAEPSAYDLRQALPTFVYIIISVMGGVSGGMSAWTLAEHRDRFDQVSIEITP